MRIAILIDALGTGGAERQAVISTIELHRRGHYVELIRYHQQNDYQDILDEHGAKSVYLSANHPFRLGRLFALHHHLKAGRFDVLHAFKQTSTIYGRIAGKWAHIPRIFGGSRDQLPSRGCSGWLVGRLAGNGGKWIVNSNVVKQAVIRDFKSSPDDIHIVPNAVWLEDCRSPLTGEQAREKFSIPQDHSVITIVANLRIEKNHPMFLRMAKRLLEAWLDVVFVIAGEGPLRGELTGMTRRLGLEGHVRFLGHCESVADLYRATDVAVLTSTSEGLPNVLIEAGGSGVPCVSSDNGGASDIIVDGRTGYIVPVGDDQAMAVRVRNLLEDADLRARMGQAARELVQEKFSTESLADTLLDVYSKGPARCSGVG